jgi:hypothetical protein
MDFPRLLDGFGIGRRFVAGELVRIPNGGASAVDRGRLPAGFGLARPTSKSWV